MKIEWKFGGSLNKYEIPNDPGVYLHILRGRISYIGEGNLQERQYTHYSNLKNKNCFFYNLIEIDKYNISDLYTLICNGEYEKNLEKKILFNQLNSQDEPIIKSIIEMNLYQTQIYYYETNDKQLSEKIEAGLQDYLIKKFNMDEYAEGKYPIGNRSNERNRLDISLKIENDFSKVLI